MKGFSVRNIRFMLQFFKGYEDFKIVKQVVSQIPSGHNIVLLQKLKTVEERLWYAKRTIENGWSRNVLVHWLESDLYRRQGSAITNFTKTLPPPQSDS